MTMHSPGSSQSVEKCCVFSVIMALSDDFIGSQFEHHKKSEGLTVVLFEGVVKCMCILFMSYRVYVTYRISYYSM